MTELPELPPPPHRVRPVPPAGVERAISAGRRRRNLFVGVTGAAAAAVAAVVFAAVALPSGGNESLQPADPTHGPVTVAPTTPATGQVDQRRQLAAATAGSRTGASARVAAVPPSAPQPAQSPHDASSPRPLYTESPQDVAAPEQCRAVPTASAGPIRSGGASGCSVSSSDSSTVRRGGTVTGSVDVCVSYGGSPMQLGWKNGQEHEVVVDDEAGNVVYRFSDTVRFGAAAHRRTISDGRCLEWTGSWNTRTSAGALVPRGRYEVHILVAPTTVNGRRTAPGEATTGGFSVDVQ